jgi:hypothetical protein
MICHSCYKIRRWCLIVYSNSKDSRKSPRVSTSIAMATTPLKNLFTSCRYWSWCGVKTAALTQRVIRSANALPMCHCTRLPCMLEMNPVLLAGRECFLMTHKHSERMDMSLHDKMLILCGWAVAGSRPYTTSHGTAG